MWPVGGSGCSLWAGGCTLYTALYTALRHSLGCQGLGLEFQAAHLGWSAQGRAGAGLSSTGQSSAGLGWEFPFTFDL